MKPKLILVSILILVIIAVGGYKYFSKDKNLPYNFTLVRRGNIVQKVSATGQVTPAKEVDLQFEIQGKIQTIKVEVGEKVKRGQILATLDASELNTQILEAQAARDMAKAKLDKILAGASEEEIKVYETAVENAQIALKNAQISLKNAEQNLADVKDNAENNLDKAYKDALNTLDDSYLKIYNAFNVVNSIQRTYFITSYQEGFKVNENKEIIEKARDRAKSYLDTAKENPTNENIDSALLEMKDALDTTYEALVVIRDICEEPTYRDTISATDKTSLDTQKSYINTASTNIVNAQQKISSTKLTNELNINTAQASLDAAQNTLRTAEGNLKSAQDKLAQIKAPPREADVALAQAQLDQAEASLTKAKQQLTKANLVAPCDSIVTDIKKEEGEMVRTMVADPVISLLCLGRFQIEVDIPEADIAKVKLDNPVEISLDAFPDEIFTGRVIKIDPAETIIQGVVYYKITVGFDKTDERIKSGMTGDVDIITESKEDALLIPQRAVLIKNGKKIVRVLDKGKIKEVEVKTGIRGSEGEIEILSGLKEGDRVITFLKEK